MKSKIGTLTWALSFKKGKPNWHSYLVIGAKQDYRTLLLDSETTHFLSAKIYVCDDTIATEFQIDSQYLGTKIAHIPYYSLDYYGRICHKCCSRFDHLNSHYYENFVCWKCEI